MQKESGQNARFKEILRNLYSTMQSLLAKRAKRYLRHPQDAEKVVQETWVAALERFRTPEDWEAPRLCAWMLGVLRHKSLDLLRQKQLRSCVSLENLQESGYEPAAPGDDFADWEDVEDQLALLRQALERYADDPRFRILTEHHLKRKSLVKIAAEEGLTADQARDRQRQAMNKLRGELNPSSAQAGKRSAKRRRKKLERTCDFCYHGRPPRATLYIG